MAILFILLTKHFNTMEIKVSDLSTLEECDQMIEILEAEKLQIERRARNLSETLENRSSRVTETSQALVGIDALINGYNAAIAVITDKKVKRDLELKADREQTKRKALENRQADYSIVSLIEDQVDLNQLQVQIPVLENTIQNIQAYRATL